MIFEFEFELSNLLCLNECALFQVPLLLEQTVAPMCEIIEMNSVNRERERERKNNDNDNLGEKIWQ